MVSQRALSLASVLLLCACPADEPSEGVSGSSGVETGTSTAGSASATSTSVGSSTSPGTTAEQTGTTEPSTGTAESETATSGSGSTEGSGSSGGSSSSGGVATDGTATGGNLNCGNNTWACGDGMDNDGDGLIDLADPECTGPCDDDESSFQTGIPGDNVDCRQDCFFDGNSGQSENCDWNLRCDPSNPGEFIGCEYNGGTGPCNNQTGVQPQECIDFCLPLTPPGCDCFGCCTVQGPDGPVDVFLNGSPNCSLENLDACTVCTQSEDCVNDCDPVECELCFGETELPKGCDNANCDATPGGACDDTTDCEQFQFCFQGCCYPSPG